MKPTVCPTCNSKVELIKPKSPEDIYKRVLEIGSECLTCGISYNGLIQRLKAENFEFDNGGCLERCVREWFWNSFFHEEAHCQHENSKDDIKKLDEHLNCNFTMRSDSCMKLLSFKEAELNRESSDKNFKSAKISNRVALIGLSVSFFTLAYSLYKDYNDDKKQDKELSEIKLLLKQSSLSSKTLNTKIDTLNSSIHLTAKYMKAYKVDSQKRK